MNYVLHSFIVKSLRKYLEDYEKFRISLSQGEIFLKKVSVNVESFNPLIKKYLNFLSIKEISIDELQINIPWAHLHNEPVEIVIKGIKIKAKIVFEKYIDQSKSDKSFSLEDINANYKDIDNSTINNFLSKIINNINLRLEDLNVSLEIQESKLLSLEISNFHTFPCNEDYKILFQDSKRNWQRVLLK